MRESLEEIASLPSEEAGWWIRQLYKMPPTDPRFLALTDEQILLEWEFYQRAHPELRKQESYADPDYKAWEEQAMAEDERIILPNSKDENFEEVPISSEP